MTSVAPSCPISHSQQKISTSQQMRTGADNAGSIPRAHDLRSVITAINRMSNVISQITRGEPQINNVYPTGVSGVPDPAPPPPFPGYDPMTWQQGKLEFGEGEVRSPHPDHKGQYVSIKVIKHVKWTEGTTGHTLVYKGRS